VSIPCGPFRFQDERDVTMTLRAAPNTWFELATVALARRHSTRNSADDTPDYLRSRSSIPTASATIPLSKRGA
jgi:hypothetical protein